MRKLDLKAYAKINLSIDILGTRPDGYHEISTVMQQIGLYDEVCVKWIPERGPSGEAGIRVETGSNKRFLPKDRRNLANKAAETMIGRYAVSEKIGSGTVRIDIKKQIPVGAGLGGGSADCAAVLKALSIIWDINLSVRELCELGAEIGSDVPFCVMGQAGTVCAAAEGTGTDLRPIRGVSRWIVLSKPPISVSTANVYKGFDSMPEGAFERPDNKELIAAMEEKNFSAIDKNMINVLENYTLKAYPEVMRTKERMIEGTSPAIAVMSGSGPTIVGFYRNKKSAEMAYEKMALINRETFLTKTKE